MKLDRVTAAFRSAVQSSFPLIDYQASYRARVLSQSGNTVDVQPVAAKLPMMSKISLRHGVPGLEMSVSPGSYVMVSWADSDPSQPYAELWEGGETVISLTLNAQTLNLAGPAGDAVATVTDIANIRLAIVAGKPTPTDGGAGLQTTILAAWPPQVGSTRVKAVR